MRFDFVAEFSNFSCVFGLCFGYSFVYGIVDGGDGSESIVGCHGLACD